MSHRYGVLVNRLMVRDTVKYVRSAQGIYYNTMQLCDDSYTKNHHSIIITII